MLKIIKCNSDNSEDATENHERCYHIYAPPRMWCFCFGMFIGNMTATAIFMLF